MASTKKKRKRQRDKRPTRPGFIGLYATPATKEAMQQEARTEHRTLSQQVARILELHLKGKNAERQACANAQCDQCADGIELVYTEEDVPGRVVAEGSQRFQARRGWVHRYGEGDTAVYEYCNAARIHERSRMEAIDGYEGRATRTHTLVLIGFIGNKRGFLDLSIEEAKQRFLETQDYEADELERLPVEVLTFVDELGVYDAYEVESNASE
jgi:hypothetical protein